MSILAGGIAHQPCSPKRVFEYVVPQWWHCLEKFLELLGGGALLEEVLASKL